MITRRALMVAAAAVVPVAFLRSSFGASVPEATLYKSPQCFCCDGHAAYLRQHGLKVTEIPTHDLSQMRRKLDVPEALEGCHMILLDGYIVEGHVPVGPILRLLRERPPIKGISLPGMPEGSPGMSGAKTEPFVIYELSPGAPRVYAVE